MADVEFLVDAERLKRNCFTGIYVRAKHPDGAWISADLGQLDKVSLLAWLRSRGGDNRWAEDTVGILLGHGHLHDYKGTPPITGREKHAFEIKKP